MSMSDPLGDMLTRIRNGQQAKKAVVKCHTSRHQNAVLDVLIREGYIRGYKAEANENNMPETSIELGYLENEPVIREINRVSKPGRRIYSSVSSLPRFYNGLGITIVSTPKGVMSDNEARAQNVGGEVLCQVY
jgi:small subunit ribosomal protein S8